MVKQLVYCRIISWSSLRSCGGRIALCVQQRLANLKYTLLSIYSIYTPNGRWDFSLATVHPFSIEILPTRRMAEGYRWHENRNALVIPFLQMQPSLFDWIWIIDLYVIWGNMLLKAFTCEIIHAIQVVPI